MPLTTHEQSYQRQVVTCNARMVFALTIGACKVPFRILSQKTIYNYMDYTNSHAKRVTVSVRLSLFRLYLCSVFKKGICILYI